MRALTATRHALDIYSGRRSPHVLVLTLVALGVGMLVAGYSLGYLPVVLVVVANLDGLARASVEAFDRRPWLVVALPLMILLLLAVKRPPVALDDLLRHIAAGLRPGGYASMYAYTSLPPVELYPLFDAWVGALARRFGGLPAMWMVQGAAAAAFIGAYIASARRILGDNRDRDYWVLLGLVAVLWIALFRVMLGRPEIFMAAWLLAAAAVRGTAAIVAWAIAGLVLCLGYWLAPLYFVAVLLLPLGMLAQGLLFIALCIAWSAIWSWLSGGRLVEAFMWTFDSVAHRLPGLTVGENQPLLPALGQPVMFALLVLALWAWRQGGRKPSLLLLAAYFAASNQLRYVATIAPLLSLFVLSGIGDRRIAGQGTAGANLVRIGVVALSVSVLVGTWSGRIASPDDLPAFRLPDGAVVLTSFSSATYDTVFRNQGDVRVVPAFEVGAAERAVQELINDVGRGKLDCASLAGFRFTHLLENTLKGAVRPCLRLVETRGQWRLWTISPPPRRDGGQ